MIRLLAVAALVASTTLAPAQSPDRGRALLSEKCAQCHAIGTEGASPLAAAPPFRDLQSKYDVGALAEALAEGIVTGHAAMPVFAFAPRDVEAIIAYLRSLPPSKR